MLYPGQSIHHREIKKLREKGMPIFEIKKYFNHRSGNLDRRSASGAIDLLADHIAKVINEKLVNPGENSLWR